MPPAALAVLIAATPADLARIYCELAAAEHWLPGRGSHRLDRPPAAESAHCPRLFGAHSPDYPLRAPSRHNPRPLPPRTITLRHVTQPSDTLQSGGLRPS